MKSGRIVSGASTISQQVIRNIYHFRRTLFSKALEAWLALRLERTLSKEEILIQYLNRISYGNQAYGIEAASRLYFDKPSSDLSLAEASFLAGLPCSPSSFNPYRFYGQALSRQKEILRKMLNLGFINKEEMERAWEETLNLHSEKEKFRSPHFCDFVLHQIPEEKRRSLCLIQTTLDYSLQEKVEMLLGNHLKSLEKRGITNGAALILDNRSGEILSMVGSKDFFDIRHDGQVNGVLSLRQPGSTLKPFTYGLALEKGITAATIVEDVPIQFPTPEGNYMPENYDQRYHGPIRIRSALACSYNVPAVSVLEAIGPDLLYERLKSFGFESLKKSSGFYGLGLTLGNGEVTLLELVRAYSALSRGGIFFKEKSVLRLFERDNSPLPFEENSPRRQLFSPQVAYILTDILADRDARIPSFGYNSPLNLPFPAASKTGTSKDFRDNWTIGYTPKYTVGIWVGNFDGKPMHNVSGITGCGPLFRDIMLFLNKIEKAGDFKNPGNLIRLEICPLCGGLPIESCPGTIEEVFIEGTEPREFCSLDHQKRETGKTRIESLKAKHLNTLIEVTFPQEGDIFKIDPVLRQEYQAIKLKAKVSESTNIQTVEWWINGQKIGISSFPFSLTWNLRPGFFTIKATAAMEKRKTESRPVKITVLS